MVDDIRMRRFSWTISETHLMYAFVIARTWRPEYVLSDIKVCPFLYRTLNTNVKHSPHRLTLYHMRQQFRNELQLRIFFFKLNSRIIITWIFSKAHSSSGTLTLNWSYQPTNHLERCEIVLVCWLPRGKKRYFLDHLTS